MMEGTFKCLRASVFLTTPKVHYIMEMGEKDPSKEAQKTYDSKQIIREDDGTFTVPSETKKEVFYSVDMELRICSCPDGVLRGPCKHRKLVAQSQNMLSWDIVPEASPEMRALWMELETGKKTNLDQS